MIRMTTVCFTALTRHAVLSHETVKFVRVQQQITSTRTYKQLQWHLVN